MRNRLSRRDLLASGGAALAVAALPRPVRAQQAPIKIGTLTPLTGAGGSYGPSMRKAMEFVAQEVNAAGEIGRASCRERVRNSRVGAGRLKKRITNAYIVRIGSKQIP